MGKVEFIQQEKQHDEPDWDKVGLAISSHEYYKKVGAERF